MPRLEVVMRELGRVHRARRRLELERLRDAQVQTEPAARDRPLVQRLADERMRKREAIHLVGILHNKPRRHRRLQGGKEGFGLVRNSDDLEGGKPEVGPQHGRQRQRFQRQPAASRSKRWPMTSLTPSGTLVAASGASARLCITSSMKNGLPPVRSHRRSASAASADVVPGAGADQGRGLRSVEALEDDALEETLAREVQ